MKEAQTVRYNKELCDRYLDALIREIHLVGNQISGKKQVTSLYFGGGTPALVAERIQEIIEAVKEHYDITEGMGVELHPDNVTVPTLQMLKTAGVTKISIGIQSFQKKYQTVLGRHKVDIAAVAMALSEIHFETVSMDFTFTKSTLPVMPKKAKRTLLDAITKYCQEKGYERSSIWTFSNEKNVRYSSMTRDNFLGFGCSATTLLKEQFKINTFSVEEYCKRIDDTKQPTSLTIRFSLKQRMVYYLFWTAYSTKVNMKDFEQFFGISLKKMYGFEFWITKLLGFITEENGVYSMTLKSAFYYHYYENFYTLSYIDKMWGIMRKEAFPERIEL